MQTADYCFHHANQRVTTIVPLFQERENNILQSVRSLRFTRPVYQTLYFLCHVVDGGWSDWGNWTECSVTCGIGVMSRERKCDSPAPVGDGRPCEGTRFDVKSCNTNTTTLCIGRY